MTDGEVVSAFPLPPSGWRELTANGYVPPEIPSEPFTIFGFTHNNGDAEHTAEYRGKTDTELKADLGATLERAVGDYRMLLGGLPSIDDTLVGSIEESMRKCVWLSDHLGRMHTIDRLPTDLADLASLCMKTGNRENIKM